MIFVRNLRAQRCRGQGGVTACAYLPGIIRRKLLPGATGEAHKACTVRATATLSRDHRRAVTSSDSVVIDHSNMDTRRHAARHAGLHLCGALPPPRVLPAGHASALRSGLRRSPRAPCVVSASAPARERRQLPPASYQPSSIPTASS